MTSVSYEYDDFILTIHVPILVIGEQAKVSFDFKNVTDYPCRNIVMYLSAMPYGMLDIQDRIELKLLKAGETERIDATILPLQSGSARVASNDFSYTCRGHVRLPSVDLPISVEMRDKRAPAPDSGPSRRPIPEFCHDHPQYHELVVQIICQDDHQAYLVRSSYEDGSENIAQCDRLDWNPVQEFLRALPTWKQERGFERQAEQIGLYLFEALFQKDVREHLGRSLVDLGSHLRLRLQLDSATPTWQSAPWEYVCHPSHGFLSLDNKISVVRDLPIAHRLEAAQMGHRPLNILVVSAEPDDLEPLDLSSEIEKLCALADGHSLTIEVLRNPTLGDLRDHLHWSDTPYHVFHFLGHAGAEAGGGGLAFMGRSGMAHLVPGGQLCHVLRSSPRHSFELLFLNACYSADAGQSGTFGSTATALFRRMEDVTAAIGMYTLITNHAATVFSEGFYHALIAGCPLDQATMWGRMGLSTSPLRVEWGTPMLFMRKFDGYLF